MLFPSRTPIAAFAYVPQQLPYVESAVPKRNAALMDLQANCCTMVYATFGLLASLPMVGQTKRCLTAGAETRASLGVRKLDRESGVLACTIDASQGASAKAGGGGART